MLRAVELTIPCSMPIFIGWYEALNVPVGHIRKFDLERSKKHLI